MASIPSRKARAAVRGSTCASAATRVALGDMQHDRTRLEQSEIAFFIGRNLSERMKREMRGLFYLGERNETNVVRLPDFFERPANAHVARQSSAAIGRLFKRGDDGEPNAHEPVTGTFIGGAQFELVQTYAVTVPVHALPVKLAESQ